MEDACRDEKDCIDSLPMLSMNEVRNVSNRCCNCAVSSIAARKYLSTYDDCRWVDLRVDLTKKKNLSGTDERAGIRRIGRMWGGENLVRYLM